ncbi:MAG: alanine--tRNA ligase-related protein, partial [Terriglobales bacterium]
LVFMQFDRDATGTLSLLPKPSIDTGLGLERMAAVLQGVISNYDTDLFTPLIERAAELTRGGTGAAPVHAKRSSGTESGNGHVGTGIPARPAEQSSAATAATHGAASLRVIADHSRAATFLISDGVIPSNEGRGYVLRKIIRRAIAHGRVLGQMSTFLHQMVFAVRNIMRGAYPELQESAERVSKAVHTEETRFLNTLGIGFARLFKELREVQEQYDEAQVQVAYFDETGELTYSPEKIAEFRKLISKRPTYPGEQAFRLFETFGLPKDFIADACRDEEIVFDEEGFEQAMSAERERARASWRGAGKQSANPVYGELKEKLGDPLYPERVVQSQFVGYSKTEVHGATVLAIIRNRQGAQELNPGDKGEIILDHTPFYAESGGQVGDRGLLYSNDHNTVVAEVTGTYAPIQGVRAHQVIAKQPIRVGDKLDAVVNADLRAATMRNHTATHLLQAGLREVLGKHVKQAGSLVAPNHLRFDFSHFTGVAEEELQDIEDIINKEVLTNEKIEVIENVPIDVAINEYHAMALFGEKYGDRVRVIKIGDFSTELCGGTHTAQTGEIGLIKILKEGSVSSGVRRIEAVTGEGSLRHFRKDHQLEGVVASLTNKEAESPAEALRTEIDRRDAEIKRLTRELDQVRMKSASSSAANLGDKVKEVRGIKVLAHRADNLDRAQMRTLVDQLRDKLGSGVVVVGSATNGNVSLIAGVTKDLTSRVQAGKIVGKVAEKVGGKGGGRPDLAEAGGKDASALDAALADVYSVVESLLG